MGKNNDQNNRHGLPWLVGDPEPTIEVLEEIVNMFHTYAIHGSRKHQSKDEEDKRIPQTFLRCCSNDWGWDGLVWQYFKRKASEINTREARDIADDARNLVAEFNAWFHKQGPSSAEDWLDLSDKWARIVTRFNMCMPTEKQQQQIEPIAKLRFECRPGQVLFDGKDLKVKTGLAQEVLTKLHENYNKVVKFSDLEIGSSGNEASVQLRDAISHINKKLKDLPFSVENRRGIGYILTTDN